MTDTTRVIVSAILTMFFTGLAYKSTKAMRIICGIAGACFGIVTFLMLMI